MMSGLSLMGFINKNRTAVFRVIVIAACLTIGCTGCAKSPFSGLGAKTVGKKITEDKFREFYYTYATTVNPPEFQRYRFYKEDGKYYFYHEKREGNKVFLTEDDITVSGTKELLSDEWNVFWSLIDGGTVTKRKESVNSGSSGPWLYLYWDDDKGVYQEFSFNEYDTVYEFETFCEELVESMNDK